MLSAIIDRCQYRTKQFLFEGNFSFGVSSKILTDDGGGGEGNKQNALNRMGGSAQCLVVVVVDDGALQECYHHRM